MCGRTCMTLDTNQIQCACKYSSTEDKSNKDDKLPEWRSEFNLGRKYQPSVNVAPTDITPVLVSADHFNDDAECDKYNGKEKECKRSIVPMMWGMIPIWHKGDPKKHGLTTNNCRLESMKESKLYRGPFRKGQRCVILCEGFYEWQTVKQLKSSERPVYYLYMPQLDNIKMYDKSTWDHTNCNINLLKLAGLFDVWKDENGDQIYSYSVITFESNETLSWLHHRTPAILETDQQISDWLDFKRVSSDNALAVLTPPKKLCWYKVSNMVNNSRNKDLNCNKPLTEVKNLPKSNLMRSWLTLGKRKEEEIKNEVSGDVKVDFENIQKPTKIRKLDISEDGIKESGAETITKFTKPNMSESDAKEE